MLLLAIVLLAFAHPLRAQAVRIGVRADAPLASSSAEMAGGVPPLIVSSTPHRAFGIGPTAEISVSKSLFVTVDALYHRFASDRVERAVPNEIFAYVRTDRTVANRWEFPFLLKYRIRAGRLKAYAGGGVSIGHPSGGRTSVGICAFYFADPYLAERNNGCRYSEMPASSLDSRTAPGVVGAGGVEFSFGRVRVSPEFRYTRWISDTPGAAPHEWPQAQFLLGLTL